MGAGFGGSVGSCDAARTDQDILDALDRRFYGLTPDARASRFVVSPADGSDSRARRLGAGRVLGKAGPERCVSPVETARLEIVYALAASRVRIPPSPLMPVRGAGERVVGRMSGARACGEVPEWSKGHAWRACVPSQVPRVRIPPSPLSLRPWCATGRVRTVSGHRAVVARSCARRRREPRQVRKEATVPNVPLCRRAP